MDRVDGAKSRENRPSQFPAILQGEGRSRWSEAEGRSPSRNATEGAAYRAGLAARQGEGPFSFAERHGGRCLQSIIRFAAQTRSCTRGGERTVAIRLKRRAAASAKAALASDND